uniref:Bestrophin homolog n=1 Tax=Angiostrongylus cantonensis TaxID=6313 RepID=A0A0K0DEE9_ANGCA
LVVSDVELPNFEPWRNKRLQILNANVESNKAALSCTSGLRRFHVNKLRELLITAWQDNKRIEAVRLVTELARLLSAPTTPSFFPVQWVLVTDILDLFGKLVYDRLFSKANEERKAAGCAALLNNFVSDDILPDTTEVARNWFCKIADIKEVVPRFYVESTLIGCLRFLDSATLSVNLLRLTKMVDSQFTIFIFSYARAYICKISMVLEPTDRGPHWKALNDWMQSSRQPVRFITLFIAPALEWIVQCVSYGATTMEDLGPLWEYCKQPGQQVSLLHPFVVAVSLNYLSNYCIEVCEIVSSHAVLVNSFLAFISVGSPRSI